MDVTKAQDILVALKLCLPNEGKPFAMLAKELGLIASEVHASIARLGEARLVKKAGPHPSRKFAAANRWSALPAGA